LKKAKTQSTRPPPRFIYRRIYPSNAFRWTGGNERSIVFLETNGFSNPGDKDKDRDDLVNHRSRAILRLERETRMNTWEAVAEKTKDLPSEKQRKVLDFVEALRRQHRTQKRLRSPRGLLADLGVDISAEDIDEARREMWGNFPRNDI
jgi:hypothetical protein